MSDVETWVFRPRRRDGCPQEHRGHGGLDLYQPAISRGLLMRRFYRITGKAEDLEEALQVERTRSSSTRSWPLPPRSTRAATGSGLGRNLKGNIYFGDGGTATSALCVILDYADPKKRWLYLKALERYARFVVDGCLFDLPQGRMGRESTAGWVIGEGRGQGRARLRILCRPSQHEALHDRHGRPRAGHSFPALYALTEKPEYKTIATDAVTWLLKSRKPDGEIP